MNQDHVFRCWQCNRRLDVDEVQGSVVVLCPKCRAKNRITRPLQPRFREQIEVKAAN